MIRLAAMWSISGFVSTTDPEASVVRKGKGKAKLHYQTHRGIDGAYGVITATVVGPGDENEAHRLRDLIEAHQDHTRHNVEVVVADSKYGTTANFFDCHDHGITAHMPVLKQTQDQQERRRKIFSESRFIYDPHTDTYSCPGGQTLTKRKHWAQRKAFEYVTARGVCQQCSLRSPMHPIRERWAYSQTPRAPGVVGSFTCPSSQCASATRY